MSAALLQSYLRFTLSLSLCVYIYNIFLQSISACLYQCLVYHMDDEYQFRSFVRDPIELRHPHRQPAGEWRGDTRDPDTRRNRYHTTTIYTKKPMWIPSRLQTFFLFVLFLSLSLSRDLKFAAHITFPTQSLLARLYRSNDSVRRVHPVSPPSSKRTRAITTAVQPAVTVVQFDGNSVIYSVVMQ